MTDTTTDRKPVYQHGPYAGCLRDISAGADVAQAMSEAGLLWGVDKLPLYGAHSLDPVPVRDRALMVRVDSPIEAPTALAVVGADYTPITNLDAFAPLDVLRERGLITFDQGGATRDGRHVFLLCRLDRGATMPGGDPHHRYILAKTSHDGTGALRLVPIAQRYWCCNQMPSLIAARGAVVSIHHGRSAATRMEQLPAMLDMLVTSLDTFDEEWARLVDTKVTTKQYEKFEYALFPMPNGADVTQRMRQNVHERRYALRRLFLDSPANENIRGTKAALVAAATEWDQHHRIADPRRRAARALEGRDVAFTRRAWDLAHA